MEYKFREKIDPKAPYLPAYTGYLEETVKVGDKERPLLMYVPENTRTWGPSIIVIPEAGISVKDALIESGWKYIADMAPDFAKPIILVMEAKDGWNINEKYGDKTGDVAYLTAVYDRMMHRNRFATSEGRCYIIGYGEGGTIAEMAVMNNPAIWTAGAAVGPKPVSEAYKKAAGGDICEDLNGFVVEGGYGIKKKEMPVPFWVLEDTNGSCAESDSLYWRETCECDATPHQCHYHTVEYVRTKETPYPKSQDKNAYICRYSKLSNPQDKTGYLLNQTIFTDFFDRIRRYRSFAGGDLRLKKDMIYGLKCEYHYEDVAGWMREWYVYVPDSVKKNPDKKVPLVFACHGYTCHGNVYAENSCWDEVADKYGFIVVFPSAANGFMEVKEENIAIPLDPVAAPAWNVAENPESADELVFFDRMYETVTRDHAIDKSRVYFTGHSMGSMMTFFIAINRSDLLAAAAPCSGVMIVDTLKYLPDSEGAKKSHSEVPIWMFGGEKEEWLLPAIPEGDNITAGSIRYWWERNNMPGPAPTDFTSGWTNEYDSAWNDITYKKDGKEMVKYTWIEKFCHATTPEMSFRIWEEFFSKYTK